MSLRLNAIQNLSNTDNKGVVSDNTKTVMDNTKSITNVFASSVFTLEVARQYLSNDAYKALRESIRDNQKIDRTIADQIANGVKAWATSKGVTHYTHWFQPLTGTTAEKHDSFFTIKSDGSVIDEFDGGALIQQEPDASSFPSGGLRATFEARGYTLWDPSSPMFIMQVGEGFTLCIPTIFISYTGDSLGFKGPLLKTTIALNKAATNVCHYFDKSINKVTATLGWEQEYFVVDEGLLNGRPDLLECGRTLFGVVSAKGQQLEDHYFGSIPERVYAFMRDFEMESYKLGIPLKTRHNEVAPSQFECAPIFENVNVAVDHNCLLMDIMDRVAKRHNLRVLFHEKPFAGINGSGKHNNWSLGTDTGINLLSPGKNPKSNLMFLTFFVNVIKAVHDHADLLRASIASAGNDFRLGANEAPPAIISVFVGSLLFEVLEELQTGVTNGKVFDKHNDHQRMDVVKNLPELLLDNTDRNRTSPFAFTGNKFEFRAVGAAANCSNAMTVLNTVVADTLVYFKKEVDMLIEKGEKKEQAIVTVLKKYIASAKPVIFEGDGYSEEWQQEAAKRNLPNIKNTPRSLNAMITNKAKDLFERNNIYSHAEIEARYEIEVEKYIKNVKIELKVMRDMVATQIVPSSIKYQNVIVQNILGLKQLGYLDNTYKAQDKLLQDISLQLSTLQQLVGELEKATQVADTKASTTDKAIAYCEDVKDKFYDPIRTCVDKLEGLVDDQFWTLPKYRELLILR
ncbi:MAG: glutamine synthetase III [Phycisphaerales bacterium]|nr:glutamine synthetase III [Phycisphaerales bacterium]